MRAPGKLNIYPADDALALPPTWHSPGLRRLAVLEAARGSYDDAHRAMERRCGQVAGKRQMEELVRAAAVDVAASYTARTPVPSTSEVLLVLFADAKGIVMRPDALRPDTAKAAAGKKRVRGVFRTRLASGEKSCRKRMAALACVYDAAPASRRPHDVIAVPGGRTGGRALRKGPRARAKWLTASVDRDAATVIAAAFDQAEARDLAHRRCWVVLVDGDRHQIELAEAARRKVTIHLIVDLIHVIEYLWKASWCLHAKDDPTAEDWVAEHALALLHGRCAEAAARIARQADDLGLTTERRGGVEECVRYLATKEALPGLRAGPGAGLADRDRGGGGRVPPLDRGPLRHHRIPVERRGCRSPPRAPRRDHQRRLRRILAPPHRTRTSPHSAGPPPGRIRPHRLTEQVTTKEPHPPGFRVSTSRRRHPRPARQCAQRWSHCGRIRA
ncbi:hypothetical protein [Streptomyces ipomoeae]|uniref:hypothetical protein n=1 Tax=Streptomyces ipomoeae TaxID=103232 RepID=UPI0035A70E3E